MIYLAGPIEQVSPQSASSWRKEATLALKGEGMLVFDPHAAFGGCYGEPYRAISSAQAARIALLDLRAVAESDLLLVRFPSEGNFGQGTLIEIGYAYGLGKPIVIWSSVALPVFLRGLGLPQFPSLDGCLQEIRRRLR